ncbi:hypothetical protein ACWEKT_25365 [Nocardia takedensis]
MDRPEHPDSVYVRATARNRAESEETTSDLLGPDTLLAAVAGRLPDGPQLARWARELSDLHAALLTHRTTPARCPLDFDHAKFCAQVRHVTLAIDEWAADRFSRVCGARRSTHSLGEVISHVALTYVEVWWTVRHRSDPEQRHRAWRHLAEVRDGYADLVADLAAGRVQLPTGWGGAGRSHSPGCQ